jgi:pyruvate/2-oxoglutarate dehydrogenase complex dihydrolipoamide dehydrogenase (E3) component
MAEHYDSIIVGAGQAGPALAVRLAQSGRRTVLVESDRFGGTCVNNGCTPTKTLIASARVAHLARRAAEFGVVLGERVEVDMARVKARKDEVVARSRDGLERWLRGTPNVSVLQGRARFEGPRQLRVGSTLLEAGEIFLDVGGRPLLPDWEGVREVEVLTNESIMELDRLPQHLVVIGGSYVGLEFAQMFRRFGAQVTVVEKGPRLIAREDEAISSAVQEILEAEGIAVRLGAECIRLARSAAGVSVGVHCDRDPRSVEGSHVLLAVGRRPNTGDLGLEHAGIETDERGYIVVDEQLRTSAAGVWALGDVNGRGAFTHTAYNDYEIVADNLLAGASRRVTDRIPAYALFIDPPLGRVGMSEREARAAGHAVRTATLPMNRVGRARERSETQGFMSVVVDASSQKILGAAILGIEGDEAIQAIAAIMVAQAPYTTLQHAVGIHPTVGELIPTLLGQLA